MLECCQLPNSNPSTLLGVGLSNVEGQLPRQHVWKLGVGSREFVYSVRPEQVLRDASRIEQEVA
jgi:hypothetical protein